MALKLLNGNKDMTIASYAICAVICSITVQITFHFDMLSSSLVGLILLICAAVLSASQSIAAGHYFDKIEVGKIATLFFVVFPTTCFMLIFGTVQEVIKKKSFGAEIFTSIPDPFQMITPWVVFGFVGPFGSFCNTELCKISEFTYCISSFLSIFVLLIVDSIRTQPDWIYIFAVLSLLGSSITFNMNMKSKLTNLKSMQEANGELYLLRIVRIVNLEMIAIAKRERERAENEIDENAENKMNEIVLLERSENEESFSQIIYRIQSVEELENLKTATLEKYNAAKQSFIDAHDFQFFGMEIGSENI